MKTEREKERANLILSYIHAHYHEKIAVDDIAKNIGLSRSECFRCFKQLVDKSLVEYINEYRLEKAAELIRETDKSLTEISNECGFENSSYFGKLFKETYAMTPLKYKKSQIISDKFRKRISGHDYEYWKNEGSGTMMITGTENNASFNCEWGKIKNIIFRGGKKFYNRDKFHDELGQITINYEALFNPYGDAYLCVYGWTIEPLVNWYIIEYFSTYKPPGEGFIGVHKTDGGVYEISRIFREKWGSIFSDTPIDFEQYWSVRINGRKSGTIDVSSHFRAWENNGMKLGKIAEISLSVEAWLSSGDVDVIKNEIIIENKSDV